MPNTDLLKIIPTLQAASLVAKKAKRKKRSLISEFKEDIIGIELIKATKNSL